MSGYLQAMRELDAETMLLTARERDAYACLLMAYARQGALPDDDTRLALAARVSRRMWGRLRPVVALYFTVSAGLWRHERTEAALAAQAARLDREAADAAARRRLSAARRAAALARWHRDGERPENARDAKLCKPDDLHMQTPPDAHANAYASSGVSEEGETGKTGLSRAGFSQSLPVSENANGHAKSRFASKRERQARKPPDPMLRLMAPIEGGKAAAEATAPPLPSAPAHFRDTWAAASAEMLRRLGLQRFHQWLSGLRVVAVESGRVTIEAPTAFDRARLGEDPQLGEQLADVLRNLDPTIEALDVVVRPREAAA